MLIQYKSNIINTDMVMHIYYFDNAVFFTSNNNEYRIMLEFETRDEAVLACEKIMRSQAQKFSVLVL